MKRTNKKKVSLGHELVTIMKRRGGFHKDKRNRRNKMKDRWKKEEW